MVVRVCLIAICASVCAGIHVNKGYFCQDPDTGLLHEVNTTWASTSFCGNYTCKIRPNHTMETSESKTIINATTPMEAVKDKINITKSVPNVKKLNVLAKNAEFFKSQQGAEAKPVFHTNSLNDNASHHRATNVINLQLQNDGEDRYLNGEEIKTISELLRTVKKSDLEAIIEIYNLAQDIYKELDDVEESNAVNGPTTSENENPNSAKMNEIELKRYRTYWYEPLLSEFYKLADMKLAGSEFIPSSTIPQRPPNTHPPYFNGVLNNQDFGKLQYYYPLSNFQQLASYYHQQQKPHVPSNGLPNVPLPTPQTPCSPCTRHSHSATTTKHERRIPSYTPRTKPAEPTLLLPYPFSNPFPNATGFAYNNYNNYYKGNPWTYYDNYRINPYYSLRPPQAKNPPQVNPSPVQNKPMPVEAKVVAEKPKNESKPWQTEPLTQDLINEIRANIVERSKLLRMPLRKRIKLERVAKVIKLDHLSKQTRVSRHVQNAGSGENNGIIEVYVEKTTCETDTELGYFRVGNMSQPFPYCCPQKIDSR